MSKPKKKQEAPRIRSPHPGVVLVKREREGLATVWRAKYEDPDSGQTVWFTLDPEGLRNEDARVDWAKKKSRSLAYRRMEIASGAPRLTKTPIDDAVDEYLAASAVRLRPATYASYRRIVKQFAEFTKTRGIEVVEELRPAHLGAYRESEIRKRKWVTAKKLKRGRRVETRVPRSAFGVNGILRAVETFIHAERRLGRTPHLNRDTIAESLKELVTPKLKPSPLSTTECRKLLQSALDHDRAVYKMTRFEHAEFPSTAEFNRTRRYAPIGPFVAFVLLTGARLGEARNLRWSDVQLDAKNERGEVVGQIRLEATATKSHTTRIVDLGVSPWLRSLLVRMRLRAGEVAYVFGGAKPMPVFRSENARLRMIRKFQGPDCDWQRMRQTCGSYLSNAPGIFGAASVFRSALQLGHSVAVAQKHYLGVIRGLPAEARTLEDAMEIRAQLEEILQDVAEEHRYADRVSDRSPRRLKDDQWLVRCG